MSWRNFIPLLLLIGNLSYALPSDESWYLQRADTNMKNKNYPAAIEALEKAVKINPANKKASRELGLVYEQQGAPDKAIEQFDRHLAQFPDDAEIAFKQANYLEWSRYEYRRRDAVRFYEQGLRHQENPIARRHLAKLLAYDRSTLDGAIVQYEKLIETSPNDLGLRKEYLSVLLGDRKYQAKALREAEKLAARYPGDASLRRQQAKALSWDPARETETVDLYADLVTKSPQDRSLRLEYAKSLSQNPKYAAAASNQYQWLLRQQNDFPTQLAYADMLARDPHTEGQARDQYEKMLASQPANINLRLKYASLLAGRKETAPEAVNEFEKILQRDPFNRDAHRGAALAYSTIGDRDRAYYHSSQAGETTEPNVKETLTSGREPLLGANFQMINQSGNQYSLEGYTGSVRSRTDLGPSLSIRGELGPETYVTKSETSSSPFFGIGGQYRITPRYRIDADLGYHPMKLNGPEALLYGLQASSVTRDLGVRLGFRKEMRTDSLLSTVGEQSKGQKIGAARSNLFYAGIKATNNDSEVLVTPALGWVSTADGDSNGLYQLDSRLETNLFTIGALKTFVSYHLLLTHYDHDASATTFRATEPFGGGYYSPKFFWSQAPKLGTGFKTESQALKVEAGPSLQFASELNASHFRIGVEAGLDYALKVGRSFQWELAGSYTDVADAYHLVRGNTSVSYLF